MSLAHAIARLKAAIDSPTTMRLGLIDAAIEDLRDSRKAALKRIREDAPGQETLPLDDALPRREYNVSGDGVVLTPADMAVTTADPTNVGVSPADAAAVNGAPAVVAYRLEADGTRTELAPGEGLTDADRTALNLGGHADRVRATLYEASLTEETAMATAEIATKAGLSIAETRTILKALVETEPPIRRVGRGRWAWSWDTAAVVATVGPMTVDETDDDERWAEDPDAGDHGPGPAYEEPDDEAEDEAPEPVAVGAADEDDDVPF